MIASTWWERAEWLPEDSWKDYPVSSLLDYFEEILERELGQQGLWMTLNRRSFGIWQ